MVATALQTVRYLEDWSDPLDFSRYQLGNGMTVLQQHKHLPFTTVFIYIPYGYAHSIYPNLGGSAHMLEHLIAGQSKPGSQFGQFHQQVGLKGGWANSGVSSHYTMFVLSIPSQHFDAQIPAFGPMVFEPTWDSNQLIKERTVIRNERMHHEKWYPGKNAASFVAQTMWQYDCPYPLEQKFGSDEDLELMSNESLRGLHQNYFNSGTTIIAIGSGDLTPLLDYLGELRVHEQALASWHEPIRWVKREFGLAEINSGPFYQLVYGGFVEPLPDVMTATGLDFVVKYLTNTNHGVLFDWLRNDLGWVYSVSDTSMVDANSYDWTISLPLNDYRQVEAVQSEFRQRIEQALDDQEKINTEVDRRINQMAYLLCAPMTNMEHAQSEFTSRGAITNLSDRLSILDSLRDKYVIQDLFDRHWSAEEVGSICFAPANTER